MEQTQLKAIKIKETEEEVRQFNEFNEAYQHTTKIPLTLKNFREEVPRHNDQQRMNELKGDRIFDKEE